MPARLRWIVPLCGTALCGCLGTGPQTEILEARLRDQQDLVARYEKLLDESRSELELARGESHLLRSQLADSGRPVILPEQADVLLRAEKLAFHSLMTGARDVDGQPGDDTLNIVLTPQSEAGDTVRLIGALEVEVLDLSQSGNEQSIGRWTYSAEEARDLWHGGFLASGFQLDLPWKRLPESRELTLHARLVSPDGRQLDATHQIRIDEATVQLARLDRSNDSGEPELLPALEDQPESAEFAPPMHAGFQTGARVTDASATTYATARAGLPPESSVRSMSGAEFLDELDGRANPPDSGRRVEVPQPLDVPTVTAPRPDASQSTNNPFESPAQGGEPVLAPPAFPEPAESSPLQPGANLNRIGILPLPALRRQRRAGEDRVGEAGDLTGQEPSPFPVGDGLPTSVNWTPDEVPVLR
jgi:hypothetical protein